MTKGFVICKGHRVQQYRIRESLIRTDPVGMMNRWSLAVRRRKYQVKSPLSLWHIDGNHKLIRYVANRISVFMWQTDLARKINVIIGKENIMFSTFSCFQLFSFFQLISDYAPNVCAFVLRSELCNFVLKFFVVHIVVGLDICRFACSCCPSFGNVLTNFLISHSKKLFKKF